MQYLITNGFGFRSSTKVKGIGDNKYSCHETLHVVIGHSQGGALTS